MSVNHIRFDCALKSDLVKLLRTISRTHGLWQVFKDFMAMSAIALSNAVDLQHFEVREAQYMQIVRRYTKEEAVMFARGLAYVVDALEQGHQDFLGSLFMSLELGDSWKGQFFTPYEICKLMSVIAIGDNPKKEIARKGFISFNDPCVGGGAMVIAAAHVLHDAGINYQSHMHVIAADIDIVSVHMSFIQFSLFHIPAVVCHANSLSLEVWSEWRTPAHIMGGWDLTLARSRDGAWDTQIANELLQEEVFEMPVDSLVPIPAAIVHPPASINLRSQMALF